MNQEAEKGYGMTEGTIWKQILIFFFPVLLGTFFQQLYNTADSVIVGRFVGPEALAAVGGSASVLVTLLISLFTGISTGSTVMVSQYFGAGKYEGMGKAVHTSVAFAIVAGFFMMVIGLLLSPFALRLMGTPEAIFSDTKMYLRIYLLGTIPTFIYNVGAAVLRAVGDTKRPLIFLMICCCVNVVLDLLLVVVFDLAVLGVAIATVTSQVISAVLVILALQRTEYFPPLSLKELSFTPNILQGILLVGIPAGLQSDMYSIANVIIQSTINTFGTNTIAAWSAYGKIESFFFMVMSALGISITTFSGQNFGAKKIERVKKSVKIGVGMALGIAACFSLIFHFGGTVLLGLFTTDPEVLKLGLEVMGFVSPFYFTYVCIEVMSGAIRGTGEALPPMLITSCGICLLRVLWIFIVVPQHNTLGTVVASYPISWSLTTVIFIIYYSRGNWLKRRLRIYGKSQEEELI